MFFSYDQLKHLREKYQEISHMHVCLMMDYQNYKFNDKRAKEYAIHGFSRRLGTVVQCIHNIFQMIPPDRINLPNNEELSNAAINLQAFVFNVFGITDNIARI